jgi:1-acyl-sn-glycerol-3-phosphate acyltransferase
MRKEIRYPRRQLIRKVLKAGIGMAFGILTKFEIEGEENIPAQGPLIVVANHFNFIDTLVLIHMAPWPMEFVGGAKMPNAPTSVHFLQRLFGVIPTYRGTGSRGTLYGAETILRRMACWGSSLKAAAGPPCCARRVRARLSSLGAPTLEFCPWVSTAR